MAAVPRPAIALALALGFASCTFHVRMDANDFDGLLQEMGTRCVVREAEFTLWSPYDPQGTRAWTAAVAEERAAVLAALGGDAPVRRVQVVLEPVQGLGPTIEGGPDGSIAVRAPGADPLRGLRGWAAETTVTLYVPALLWVERSDGQRIPASSAPQGRRDELRHELAHWRAYALGIEGGDWLEEGLAQLVEGLALEDGRLLDRGAPHQDLALARAVGVQSMPLVELLDWREEGRDIVEVARSGDRERELGVQIVPRTACGLYLRFLLGWTGDGTPVEGLAERLDALSRLSRAELLDGEARWRVWLAAELERHASAVPER